LPWALRTRIDETAIIDLTGIFWMEFLRRRREFNSLFAGAAAAWPLPARAQPMSVIGIMSPLSVATTARVRIIISCCREHLPSRPALLTIDACSLSAKDTKFCRAPPTAFRMTRPPNVSSCLSKGWVSTTGTGPIESNKRSSRFGRSRSVPFALSKVSHGRKRHMPDLQVRG
jgi:hypothetical protein